MMALPVKQAFTAKTPCITRSEGTSPPQLWTWHFPQMWNADGTQLWLLAGVLF